MDTEPPAELDRNNPVELDTCPFCGDELLLDLLEIWPAERSWIFDTCCEQIHHAAVDAIHAAQQPSRTAAAHTSLPYPSSDPQWLKNLFAGYGIAIRRAYDSQKHAAIRLDYGLTLNKIDFAPAMDFIDRHHRHNGRLPGWKWGHAIHNGPTLIAVAIVGTPRARMIATREPSTLETNRICTRTDIDPELTWNACSMLYGAAPREARRRNHEARNTRNPRQIAKLITYTRTDEDGTSLIAAGWEPEHTSKGGSWDSPARRRIRNQDTGAKTRWARWLAPRPQPELFPRH